MLQQLTEVRETLTFTSLLKDAIKDTDEQPDGEREARGKAGEGPDRRSFCPHGDGVHRLLVWMFASLEALRTLHYWDFMEASSHRHGGPLTPFPAPLTSHENRS